MQYIVAFLSVTSSTKTFKSDVLGIPSCAMLCDISCEDSSLGRVKMTRFLLLFTVTLVLPPSNNLEDDNGIYVPDGELSPDEAISAVLEYVDRQLEWRGVNTSAEDVVRRKRNISEQLRKRKGKGRGKCNVHEIIKSSPLCMCSKPRREMVDVPASQQADVITVPRCMEIERCSGPCMNPNMKCLAAAVEIVHIPVFAIRFSSDDNHVPMECATVPIERHLSCGCSCNLREDDCSDKQVFVERECRCRCRNAESLIAECLQQGKHWDEVHCRCKCANSHHECSTGFFFHPKLCRCTLVNEV